MAWIRVDDHFDEHPKLARVGPCGWGFWVAGLAYCNRNLTDGFIPQRVARSLGDFDFTLAGVPYFVAVTTEIPDDDLMGATGLEAGWVIQLLVEAGLWEEIPGGYQVHDYHDFQPTKAKVLAERKRKATNQQDFRNRSSNQPVARLRDVSVTGP